MQGVSLAPFQGYLDTREEGLLLWEFPKGSLKILISLALLVTQSHSEDNWGQPFPLDSGPGPCFPGSLTFIEGKLAKGCWGAFRGTLGTL